MEFGELALAPKGTEAIGFKSHACWTNSRKIYPNQMNQKINSNYCEKINKRPKENQCTTLWGAFQKWFWLSHKMLHLLF